MNVTDDGVDSGDVDDGDDALDVEVEWSVDVMDGTPFSTSRAALGID